MLKRVSATLRETCGSPPRDSLSAEREAHRSVLARWHLVSLDAPSVAALWTWFIAHKSGVDLPACPVVAMFLAVWVLYIADRLLDARDLHPASGNRPYPGGGGADCFAERHYFHARYRTSFLCALSLAVLALAVLVVRLPVAALRLYALLGTLLAAYFVAVHALDAGRRLPKELAVGLFFSAAVFIPTFSRRPDLGRHLLPLALLFAALCSLNCLRIVQWEHPAERKTDVAPLPANAIRPQGSGLHSLTRVALRHLNLLHVVFVAGTVALLVLHPSAIVAALAISGAALLALHGMRHRLTRVDLRAAADLALTAPLPLIAADLLRHAV